MSAIQALDADLLLASDRSIRHLGVPDELDWPPSASVLRALRRTVVLLDPPSQIRGDATVVRPVTALQEVHVPVRRLSSLLACRSLLTGPLPFLCYSLGFGRH